MGSKKVKTMWCLKVTYCYPEEASRNRLETDVRLYADKDVAIKMLEHTIRSDWTAEVDTDEGRKALADCRGQSEIGAFSKYSDWAYSEDGMLAWCFFDDGHGYKGEVVKIGGFNMTEENKNLRDKVHRIENIAVNCLNNQPAEDEACGIHLGKALSMIAQEADGFQGLVEVEAYDIDWDVDDEEVMLVGVPEKARFMMHPDEIEAEIANRLSDRYGWCVKSCKWRI